MGKAAAEAAGPGAERATGYGDEGPDVGPLRLQKAERARLWERRRLYAAHILAIMIVAIGALDCVSTNLALGTGHAEELNPVVRWIQSVFGAYWVWPKMAIHAGLAAALLASPSRAALVAMTAVSMMTLIAAANNLAIYHTYAGIPA